MDTYDVIVIGGGQSGMAAGYYLQRAGLSFVILEAGSDTTGSWGRYYDSLRLFSPARYSSLPGMSFPGDPQRYPARDEVMDYLRSYARRFNLPIMTHTRVDRVDRGGAGRFEVQIEGGQTLSARSVIAATGAFNRPHLPRFDGMDGYRGRILHSAQYTVPKPFEGQQVLVIGAGNSAVQIAVELARVARVTLTSREPVRFRRQYILGRDVHFWFNVTGYDRWQRRFPKWNPFESVQTDVLDTAGYQAALRSGNPQRRRLFSRFVAEGVQWEDGAQQRFDSVISATGFRPNLPYLQALGALDAHGNALQTGGISDTVAGLYYVGISGQRSFASATLRGVGEDAAYVIEHLAQYLQSPAPRLPARCCLRPHLVT